MNNDLSLKIWERIEIKVPVGDLQATYATRIQSIDREGIHIDRPGIEQRLFPLKVGSDIWVEFTREDAAYRFRSQVLRFYQEGNLPFMVIAPPVELERIQRRQHFRLAVEMPIRFHIPLNPPGALYSLARQGMVRDISAGGVCFSALEADLMEATPGCLIQVSFTLEKQLSVFRQEARVLRIAECSPNPERRIVTCSFENIPFSVQEAIIVHNIRYQQRFRIERGF